MGGGKGLRVDDFSEVLDASIPDGRVPGLSQQIDADCLFLYDIDGLAAAIVDKPAEDALSRGFTVAGDEGDEDGEGGFILNEIDRLHAIRHMTDAQRWARLHGAAACLVLMDDGLQLTAPVDLNRIQTVTDLIPYDLISINAERDRYQDPALRNYGTPIYYTLTPPSGDRFVVHESRLLPFTGGPMDRKIGRTHSIPWIGRPALTGCGSSLIRYNEGLQLTRAILERKQQPVHAMAGLAGSLESDEGKAVIRRRLEQVDKYRGLRTTVAVDGEDKFSVLDAGLAGIDAVMGCFRLDLAAKSRIPVPILMGEGLSGLGNSGTGEQGIYHGLIVGIQERMRPALERLITLLWAQKALRVKQPEKWRIVWHPLWSPSENEMADVATKKATARKTEVEALDLMITGQMMLPEEARAFARETWGEYKIGNEAVPEPEPVEPDADPAAA